MPRKNVRHLGGKPLVAWAIEAGLSSRVNRLVVSSDDDEALSVASSYSGVAALHRPAELASDTSPAIDYVRHALAHLEAESRTDGYDVVVILQPTSPFTHVSDINDCLELLERSGADTVVTVMHVDHAVHPVKMKVFDGDRLLPYVEEERGRMAAHQLPDVYVRNCSVYATRRHVIDAGEIIGADCRGVVMPRERSVDINDELDFAFAEFLLSRKGSSK